MSRAAPPAADSGARFLPQFTLPGGKAGWVVVVGSALAAAVISLSLFAPRYWLWPGVGTRPADLISVEPELHRAFFALRQLQDPWQRIDNNSNQVIEWRVLWPAIAHYTRLPVNGYLALPPVGCLLTLLAAAGIVWRATRNAWVVAGGALLAATSSWFFVSAGWLAYFDSWLVLLLLLASFAQTRSVLFVTALLAPWIDERFILALPLCLTVRALNRESETPASVRPLGRDALILLLGIAPYVLVRFGAEFFHLRETSHTYWVHRPALPASFSVMLEGAWQGLRFGWVAALAWLVITFRRRYCWIAALAALASLALNVSVADDLSRSASIAVPLLLGGLVFAWRTWPRSTAWALAAACVGNVVFPAAHIIAKPFQADETYHRIALRSLSAEIDQARHPPEFARGAAYRQRGLEAFQAGNLPLALRNFDVALRFDPTDARARANRGLILFSGDRRAEGMAELDRALRDQPNLYVARLQRAGLRQQLGDLTGALADSREVLRQAPASWPGRKDAEELERALQAIPPVRRG